MIIKVDRNIKNIFKRANVFFSIKGGDDRIKVGSILKFPRDLQLEPYCSINSGNILGSMGAFSYTHSSLPLKNISIGRYCSIAAGLSLQGGSHPIERFSSSSVTYDDDFHMVGKALRDNPNSLYKTAPNTEDKSKKITVIHNDVWIGGNVTLAPGIEIGNGAIVGSNSLVTKDVPPYAIVGGVPAKIIRYRFSESIIAKLLALKWWEFAFWDFEDFDVRQDIEKFVIFLENKIESGTITRYSPELLTLNSLLNESDCVEQLNNKQYLDIKPEHILNNSDCDFCRNEALKIENDNLKAAFHLMKLAYLFRPDGVFIKKKLKEYEEKLKVEK